MVFLLTKFVHIIFATWSGSLNLVHQLFTSPLILQPLDTTDRHGFVIWARKVYLWCHTAWCGEASWHLLQAFGFRSCPEFPGSGCSCTIHPSKTNDMEPENSDISHAQLVCKGGKIKLIDEVFWWPPDSPVGTHWFPLKQPDNHPLKVTLNWQVDMLMVYFSKFINPLEKRFVTWRYSDQVPNHQWTVTVGRECGQLNRWGWNHPNCGDTRYLLQVPHPIGWNPTWKFQFSYMSWFGNGISLGKLMFLSFLVGLNSTN